MSVFVKQGQPIPLQVQLTDGRTDLVIRADLYNLDTGNLLPSGANVLLSHVASGFYKNTAFTMPGSGDRVQAQYKLFEADGLTPNTKGDQFVTDIFVLNDVASDVVSSVGQALRDSDFVAVVDEFELTANIVDDDTLSAFNDNTTLTAYASDFNFIGTVDNSENIAELIE